MKYLIEHGTNINKENKRGKTPIFRACEIMYVNEDIVKYLIECGADIDKEDRNGETPLFKTYLTSYENISVFFFLLILSLISTQALIVHFFYLSGVE